MTQHPAFRKPEWRHPLPDESFDGYLAYRAAFAMMPGPFAISELGGACYANYPQIAFGYGSHPDGIEAMADSLGIPPDELRSRAHHETAPGRRRFGNSELAGRLIEKKVRWFSPTSLIRSAHHRAIWSVRCLPFCEESWETLTDTCPWTYCRAVQRWRRTSGVDRCDQCGGCLTVAAATAVPEEMQPALRLLCGLLHHEPERNAESLAALPSRITAIGPGGIVEATYAVANLVDPGLAARFHTDVRPDVAPLRLISAMATAFDLLRHWPCAGEHLVAGRLATRRGRYGDGNEGATLRFIAIADRPARDARTSAVSPPAVVAGMLADALRANRSEGLPLKQAFAGSGMNMTQLSAARREGRVRTVFHLAGQRILPLIANESLLSLRDRRAEGPYLQMVATALGVPNHGVEQLLLQGMLSPASDASRPPFAPHDRIDADSVDLLRRRIDGAAVGTAAAGWISVAMAARRTGGGLKPWAAWFAAVIDGTIPSCLLPGDGPLSDLLMIAGDEQTTFQEMIDLGAIDIDSLHQTMTREDAAETLNIHPRHRSAAFSSWPSSPGRRATVPLREVLQLADEWISTSELAELLGASSRATHLRSLALGVPKGAFGHPRGLAFDAFGLSVDRRTDRTRAVGFHDGMDPASHLVGAPASTGVGVVQNGWELRNRPRELPPTDDRMDRSVQRDGDGCEWSPPAVRSGTSED